MRDLPPIGSLTVHDMTVAALSEVNPRARAALAVLGPNRAGDPMVGLLGSMSPGDCLDLIRAADLAHTRAGTEGWLSDGMTVEEMARHIARYGAWRDASDKWRERVVDAMTRYQLAIRDEMERAS